jgi:hypothetical protein
MLPPATRVQFREGASNWVDTPSQQATTDEDEDEDEDEHEREAPGERGASLGLSRGIENRGKRTFDLSAELFVDNSGEVP